MNKERLIELAKQAGWEYADDDRGFEPLWRFAALVRADEREACMNALNALPYQRSTKYDCMDAIRARGETK